MAGLLEMKQVSKDYGKNTVLNHVTLELDKGEVLALIGENGAGKSTLIKILEGSVEATHGDIYIEGEEMKFLSPYDALQQGISVIHQEINCHETLSIAENIFVGRLPQKGFAKKIDWYKLFADAQKVIDTVGLDLPPQMEVSKLTTGQKQLLEIGKAISRESKIIVMDEPTAALNDSEVYKLFEIIKALREREIGIIYISHRLDEVFEISDKVKVLRDGNDVWNSRTDEVTKGQLVHHMVGREIGDMYPKAAVEIGECVLDVSGLTGDEFQNVSLKVNKGEIVSLFGLMGCGNTQILEGIYGVKHVSAGEVAVDGEKTMIHSPPDALEKGITYLPSERKAEGLVMVQSIRENIILPSLDRYNMGFKMNNAKEIIDAGDMMRKLNIKADGLDTEVGSLSGGNQQKVVIGKCILRNPKVMMVNEPTRGVDVGAKVEVYRAMEEMCKQGVGILMVSSELPETLALSDRIYVVNEGKVVGEFTREEATQERLMQCILIEKETGGENRDEQS